MRVRASWAAGVIEALTEETRRIYPNNLVVAIEEPDETTVIDQLAAKVGELEERIERAEENAEKALELLAMIVEVGAFQMREAVTRISAKQKEEESSSAVEERIIEFNEGIRRLGLPARVRIAINRAVNTDADRWNILGDPREQYTFEQWIRELPTSETLQERLGWCRGIGEGSLAVIVQAAIGYLSRDNADG